MHRVMRRRSGAADLLPSVAGSLEFPNGGPLAALYFPSYRLALVKPGWSVAEGQNLAGVALAALTRVTLDLSYGT